MVCYFLRVTLKNGSAKHVMLLTLLAWVIK